MMKKVFLVNPPDSKHEVIRCLKRNELFNYERVSYRQINDLVSSKTITQLLNAIEKLPVSLPYVFNDGVFVGCEFVKSEYIPTITNSSPDEELLYNEIGILPNENLKKIGITEYYFNYIISLDDNVEFIKWLKEIDDRDDCEDVKIIEPLSNWIFVRNLTAFLMKTRYFFAQGFKKESLLEKIGFIETPGAWIYRLKSNDYESESITIENSIKGSCDIKKDYFENGVVLGRGNAYQLDEAANIGFRPSLSLVYDDAYEYLLFDICNDLDIDYGEEIIRCIFNMLDSKPYGWGYSGPRIITNDPMNPELQARSALAQFSLMAFDVHANEIDFCKQCGTVLLSTGKGRKKEFCSTVCRVKYSRENK